VSDRFELETLFVTGTTAARIGAIIASRSLADV
jgi:hypothetical protein